MGESGAALKENIGLGLPRLRDPRLRLLIELGAALLFLGLLAGLLLAPELAVYGLVGVGLGIPLFLLVWNRPEFGLLALIFLTSSFVPADLVDIRLPIGGGLDLRDLVLIGMLGLLFLRELTRKTISIPWWKVGGPLVLFLLLAVISTVYAIVFQKVESHWALSDMRILFSYVVFFLVIWSVKRAGQYQILMIGLFIIADLTTAIVVLQQFSGLDNPLLQAMLTTRDWRVYQGAGAVRVVPAGQILMHFMWFVALGILLFASLNTRQKAMIVFQIAYLGVGHLLTYMRAQWVAMFLGSALLGLVALPRFRSRIARYSILGLSAFLILLFLIGMIGLSSLSRIPFVAGVQERFASILTPKDTLETGSLQWREFEDEKALESIAQHPLWGVGLGGRYRALTTLQGEVQGLWTRGSLAAGEVSRFTRYVHNSYLSIAVKMGIPAFLVLMWVFAAFLIDGWRIYRSTQNAELKGTVIGIVASFVGLFSWVFFHAHLIKAESTPVIGLMIGMAAVIDGLSKNEKTAGSFHGYLIKI